MSWFWYIRVLTILSSNYSCDCKQVSWSGFHWTPFGLFNLRNYYGISFLWDKTCGSVGLLESRTMESDYDLSPNWILTYPSDPMVMISPCLRFLTYLLPSEVLMYFEFLSFLRWKLNLLKEQIFKHQGLGRHLSNSFPRVSEEEEVKLKQTYWN